MAQPTTTFLDELMAAARGCVALLLGRRDAASYFDFSQRGLVGSFIALVLTLGVHVLVPQAVGDPGPPTVSFGDLIVSGLVVGIQFGAAWLVLRQLGRLDGFTPFLVAQNWSALFQTVIAVFITSLLGEPIALDAVRKTAELTGASLPFFALSIAVLVVWINIGRLILTLRPLHVTIFIVVQLATTLTISSLLSAMV